MEALHKQVLELSTLREHQNETIAKHKQEIARLLRVNDRLKQQRNDAAEETRILSQQPPVAPVAAAPVSIGRPSSASSRR